MHHAYYFGFAETACILAGTVLEQALIHRLGSLQDLRGPLAYVKNGRRTWLADRHGLLDLELVDMLELAKAEGAIRSGKVAAARPRDPLDPQQRGARDDPGLQAG